MRDEDPITVTADVVASIVSHARSEAPYECCGLLLGEAGAVDAVVPARNVAHSRSRYRVHPEDHFGAIRAARARGLTVVGAYHSHPVSAARPSDIDLAEAPYPEYVYVILSLAVDTDAPVAAGALRAFRLSPEGVRELRLVVR
jgi:proteasome lid subunit RPN8/RPN11